MYRNKLAKAEKGVMMNKVCSLGRFAEEAAKAGYKNADGTVNLLMAEQVSKKFGKLVPKDSLTSAELSELESAIKAFSERFNLTKDVFKKS